MRFLSMPARSDDLVPDVVPGEFGTHCDRKSFVTFCDFFDAYEIVRDEYLNLTATDVASLPKWFNLEEPGESVVRVTK